MGVAFSLAFLSPVLVRHYPGVMLAIPVNDYEEGTGLRLPATQLGQADCRQQAQVFGLSMQKLGEAGVNIYWATRRTVRDHVLQEIWSRKSWFEKVVTALLGPPSSDYEEARRLVLALPEDVSSMHAISQVITICGALRETT